MAFAASSTPQEGECLILAALRVLYEPNAARKGELTHITAHMWRQGHLSLLPAEGAAPLPPMLDRPARDDMVLELEGCASPAQVELVDPRRMRRLGKGGTPASRQAILHSLVHTESWAVDLSWDIIARFGADPAYSLPKAFYDDFVTVAEDECRHYELLRARLEDLESHYGAFAAHEGLWESAQESARSLPARLAVEHCVHEARGLDVMPGIVRKFRANGDAATAQLLEDIVYREEITHCAAGVRWFTHLHRLAHSGHPWAAAQQPCSGGLWEDSGSSSEAGGHGAAVTCSSSSSSINDGGGDSPLPSWVQEARQHPSVETWFHQQVRTHFRGHLKPPFNTGARAEAGFGEGWYMPLAALQDHASAAAKPQDVANDDAAGPPPKLVTAAHA